MVKKIIYTFRTNPFKEKLQNKFSNLFIFRNLKEDFEILSKKIIQENPEIIIGIAKSDTFSRFENIAINQFNKIKKVNKIGVDKINLFIPKNNPFKQAIKPTDSFCNWTAYKIAEFLEDNKLNTKLMFVHIKEEDLEQLNIIYKDII